jgi:molybdopterin-guanine dinucleotide biosynthesis protein A
MGRSKALLPFGPEVLLQRVVRIVGAVVQPVVVVAAVGQELPALPDGVLIARDEHEALGPLGGLAVGLGVLRDQVEACYVTAVDAPLLRAEFIRHLIGLLEDFDLVMPRDGKFHHPLAAVYRTRLEDSARSLIAANRLRPFFLLEQARAREVDVAELRAVDPELASLRNTNTPEEHAAALRDAGFEAEPDAAP